MRDERMDAAGGRPSRGGMRPDGDALRSDDGGEGLDERIRAAAGDYHRPPETPREAMWDRIRSARDSGELVRVRERRARRWTVWGAGIAAVLALGIAIGRLSAPGAAGSTGGVAAGAPPTAVGTTAGERPGTVASSAADAAYRMAAAGHLYRVEAFLTQFRSEARSGRVDPDLRAPARQLLSNTRLLLASPAANDPSLRTVLDDVELVLAQIAGYSADPSRENLRFIDDGIEQRGVLLELRTLVSAESPPGLAQGAL